MTGCQQCGLAKGRTRVVPGEGPDNASIVFIGEGPGFHEDQQGRPFVGPAGQFLDYLLELAGLKREEVYICNVVKCRPPQNRDPLPTELDTCKPWLDEQLNIINPKMVVTLGRYSMARYFPGQSISRIHGRAVERAGLTVIPMFHPAAALHQQSFRGMIEEDFKKLGALIADMRREPDPEPEPEPQQLSMF